jgi:hypothetical protein
LGKGQQVGGRRIPVDEVHRQARNAAEQRAKLSKIQVPGKRLGGKPVQPGRSIRETIARAALSRTKVETGCGTGTKAGDRAAQRAAKDSQRNGFRTKAEMDDANSVAIAQAMQELMELDEERDIDTISETPPSDGLTWSAEHGLQAAPPRASASAPPASASNPFGSRKSSRDFDSQPPSQDTSQTRPSASTSMNRKPAPPVSSYPTPPAAPQVNPRGRPVSRVVLEAEAKKKQFQSLKPASSIKSEDLMKSASQPSRPPSSREPWACLECTLVNEANANTCEVCEAPRQGFSNVAPRPSSYRTSATSGPLGWLCSCGTFMEDQWWTCSRCTKLRPSS